MRKILLGTTAVCGAALLGATHAQAQTAPTLRIGGYFEFNVAYIDDTSDRNYATLGTRTVSRDKWDFRQGDTEIHLFVTGKAANGLSYGFTMELQFDAVDTFSTGTATSAGTVLDTDEAYAFVSSPTLGTLRLGDEDSAASLLQTRLPTIVGMGPDNMIDEFMANTADGQRYLISGINDGSDATKIIYLSPQFFGFDFGVSFAPNGREGEGFRSVAATSTTGAGQILQRDPTDSLRNELSGAIRYRGTFSNIGVMASFGAMRADAQTVSSAAVQLQDVTAYHLGLQLSGFGLTVGGEYNWGKYGTGSTGRGAIAQGLGNSNNWAVGVTYTMGALSLGAFYGEGTRDAFGANPDREQKVWGIGLAYNLAPGWDVVANYSQQEDRNIYTSASNPTTLAPAGSGYGQRNRDVDIFIVGTRIAF